jgi:hypothetical protein
MSFLRPLALALALGLAVPALAAAPAPSFRKDALAPATHLPGVDWVGPDGIVYPDWTHAGVFTDPLGANRRGIPRDLPVRVTLDASLQGAARADEFFAALEAAVARASALGGGVVRIPAGEYHLNRPFVVRHPGVVIRGAGRGPALRPGGRDDDALTTLAFTFSYAETDEHPVKILIDRFDGEVIQDSRVDIYFPPRNRPNHGQDTTAAKVVLYVENAETGQVRTYAWSRSSDHRRHYDGWAGLNTHGPVSFVGHRVHQLYNQFEGARLRVRAEVEYLDGVKHASAVTEIDRIDRNRTLPAGRRNVSFGEPINSIITFHGDVGVSNRGISPRFVRDAARGDRVIHLDSAVGRFNPALAPGHVLQLNSRPTREQFETLGRTGMPGLGEQVMVKSVTPEGEGFRVELLRPLRNGYSAEQGTRREPDDAFVRYPLFGVGLEDLEIRQDHPVWFNGVHLTNATHSWMRNVRVLRAGRNPLFAGALHNEIRDCEFIDPRWSNDTSGASGYVGFFGGVNCLMENIYARRTRHAPNFSGGSGSVIRDSLFEVSDAQWHAGFGLEHLMENNTVDATQGTGSYGWGVFAMHYSDPGNGPGAAHRGVVYRNDFRAPGGGAYLGGGNSGWMILWNRFHAASQASLVVRAHTRDALILGNTFSQQHLGFPLLQLGDARGGKHEHERLDSITGLELIGNRFHTRAPVFVAAHPRAVGELPSDLRLSANQILPYVALPEPLRPEMPSVFLAQLERPRGHRATRDSLYPRLRAAAAPHPTPPAAEPLLRINFEHANHADASAPAAWGAEDPALWFRDDGAPFGPKQRPDGRATLAYGWVGAETTRRSQAAWSDPEWRYRSHVEIRSGSWQLELPPGRYRLLLALGDSRGPAFTSAEGMGNRQRNDILVNGEPHLDPRPVPHDPRRALIDTEVTVGADRRLVLAPAPSAVELKLTFLQVYPLD